MLRAALISSVLGFLALSASPASAQTVAGDWHVYAKTTAAGNLCVPQVGDQWRYEFHLTQFGGSVGGAVFRAGSGAFVGPVNGSVIGNQLDLTVVETVSALQSYTHQFSLTLAGDTFSGTDDWVWTDGLLFCSGRDDVLGSRVGRRFCSADTPGACPCGNHQAAGSVGGCLNSTGAGAVLSESGYPSFGVGTFALHVTGGTPGQPGMFLQGGTQIGLPFKDGRLCMGNPTVRLQVAFLDPSGAASLSGLALAGSVSPLTTVHYQFWYRDPAPASVCGTGSNFSDALTVLWLP